MCIADEKKLSSTAKNEKFWSDTKKKFLAVRKKKSVVLEL